MWSTLIDRNITIKTCLSQRRQQGTTWWRTSYLFLYSIIRFQSLYRQIVHVLNSNQWFFFSDTSIFDEKKKPYLTFTAHVHHTCGCACEVNSYNHTFCGTPLSAWGTFIYLKKFMLFAILGCSQTLYFEMVPFLTPCGLTSEHRQNNEDTRHSLRTQCTTLTHLNLNYNEIGSVSRSQWRTFFSTRIPQVGCWSDGPHSYPQCLRGIRISRRHFGELLGGVPSPVSTTGDDGIKFV